MRLTFLHSNKKCLYIHIAIFYCGQFQLIRIKHVLRINADINIINAIPLSYLQDKQDFSFCFPV